MDSAIPNIHVQRFVAITPLVLLAWAVLALPACGVLAAGDAGLRLESSRGLHGGRPVQGAGVGVQTVIKFKDPAVDVRAEPTLRALAQWSGFAVEYVRPMAGDAHVVLIHAPSPVEYQAALARLRAAKDVQYVEPDVPVRTN